MRNILIIGGGGREHAIAHRLRLCAEVGRIYAAPGNGGIAAMENCECLSIKPLDIESILQFLRANDIYLTVVSTDDALKAGMVDVLEKNGFRAFGPSKMAAEIEWSKAYSKDFMKRNGIPSARFEVFSDTLSACKYIDGMNLPIVVKADGLALGKGVIIAQTKDEAKAAVSEMIDQKKFGTSSERVLIEEYVCGYEVTILAFCDGATIKPMVTSKDYKRIFDGDLGPNTGGMGTISPMERFEGDLQRAYDEIFMPTVKGLSSEGRVFKGVLYFDIMVDGSKFNVIEYNARFGDPEAQVVLPRLKTDFLSVLDACIDGNLDKIDLEWDNSPRVCVIAASKGYPDSYEVGKRIIFNGLRDDTLVFHAGTKLVDGDFFTSGGRVLGVVCAGNSVEEARTQAYDEIRKINFEGMYFRRDIGKVN